MGVNGRDVGYSPLGTYTYTYYDSTICDNINVVNGVSVLIAEKHMSNQDDFFYSEEGVWT